MRNVRWFLWETLKFAYRAWHSHPISQQKFISSAAEWSKWKWFQSPQPACVTLYLGHTNQEAGDAQWHHYSTKCSPPLDFLCVSVVLLKKLFIWGGNFTKLVKKELSEQLGYKVWVWSEVWGVCTIILWSHHRLWCRVVLGKLSSEVISTTEGGCYQSDWVWMAAQCSQEIPKWTHASE